MADTNDKTIAKSIASHIEISRKQVTVLFTDIVYSTQLWDTVEDIQVRLMVDKHNRYLFSVIKAHRGRVLKTIGDAIMASFKTPEDAVKAAIGIQQILDRLRRKDDDFSIHVRVGVHSGTAIVEHKDIFGDVVNTASRIEGYAERDEILLSAQTVEGLHNQGYFFEDAGEFLAKGKQEPLKIFRCKWAYCGDMIGDVKFTPFLLVGPRQKRDLLVYALAGLLVLYFIYYRYFRYLLTDIQSSSMLSQGNWLADSAQILLVAALAGLVVAGGVLLSRMQTLPYMVLRLLKGGFGLCIGLFGFYLPSLYLPEGMATGLDQPIFESKRVFVEVLEDSVAFEAIGASTQVMAPVSGGSLYVLLDRKSYRGLNWSKVMIGPRRPGWVQEHIPASKNLAEVRVARVKPFTFNFRDLYGLILGALFFAWGMANFRIKPT